MRWCSYGYAGSFAKHPFPTAIHNTTRERTTTAGTCIVADGDARANVSCPLQDMYVYYCSATVLYSASVLYSTVRTVHSDTVWIVYCINILIYGNTVLYIQQRVAIQYCTVRTKFEYTKQK